MIECGPDLDDRWHKIDIQKKAQDSLVFGSILAIFGLVTWGTIYLLDQMVNSMS